MAANSRTADSESRNPFTMKRLPTIFAIALAFFALVNVASYFLRSDGFARPGVADGILRCGFPFLFWEKGGWANFEYFYLFGFAVDVGLTIVAGVLVMARVNRSR